MLVFLICLIIVSLSLYYIYERLQTKRMKRMLLRVPGPTSYPLIGSALAFGRNSVELLQNMQMFVADFGPVFQVWVGPTLYVVLANAKDIEVVLSSTKHLNKPQVYGFLEDWLGTGLISAPAPKWKVQRKILTPAFHFKILETYIDIFNSNARVMVDVLREKVGKQSFNIVPYIDNCTLDIICETAMATSIHAQLNKESDFTNSLKVVSNAVLMRAFKPWLFPNFTFNLSHVGRQFNKHLKFINSYVDKVISEKKKDLKKTGSETDDILGSGSNNEDNFYGTKKRYVFLDLLLKYASDPTIDLSDIDIRDEVNTFMFAGHDTTASTLGFTIYSLASHQAIQNKVVDELKSVIGNSDRDPTYQELQSLKYLEQVIKETLRLYPAVPYIGRKLYEDLTLPSGYTLPAGASLTMVFFTLHRDPIVFPEPEKFNPDHFLPENTLGRFPFTYTPFSAGPRNCIGQKFAMLEIKALLCRLLRSYKITASLPEPVLAAELVLRSDTGINIQLEKRRK